MRLRWLILFAAYTLCVGAAAPSGMAEATGTDQQPRQILAAEQAEQQHPIAVKLPDIPLGPRCSVCEGIANLISTPLQDDFQANIEILPYSVEETCQVHAPLHDGLSRKSPSYNDDGRPLRVRLGKQRHIALMAIYFSDWSQDLKFELLKKKTRSHPGRAKLLDPAWFDLDALKDWIHASAIDHGGDPGDHLFAGGRVLQRPAYIIDASEGRLVDTSHLANETLQYVSLGYVRESFGDPRYISTTQGNIMRLQESGAMFNSELAKDIPRTFRDAMELVRLLGFRYIWISSLCIVHDDPASRAAEIAKMGDILVGSTLAITQLWGGELDEGIRGIKELTNPQPRDLVQNLYQWREETFVSLVTGYSEQQHPGTTNGGRDPKQKHNTIQSAWNIQEAVLPRRQLRFHQDTAEWRSGSCWSREEIAGFCNPNPIGRRAAASVFPSRYSEKAQVPGFWTDAFSLPWFSLKHYFQAIRDLGKTKLSTPGQILDAGAGLISMLGASSQGTFICGMPEERLDYALLFSAFGSDSMGSPERRQGGGPPSQPDLPWPSWSWAGWTGEVGLVVLGLDYLEPSEEQDIIPTIEWYASHSPDPDAPRRRLETRLWEDSKQRYQRNGKEPTPPGWSRVPFHSYAAIPRPKPRNEWLTNLEPMVTYTHESSPGLYFAYPIPMQAPAEEEGATLITPVHMTTERFLLGKTERAFLNIRSDDYRIWYMNQPYKLWDEDGRHVGGLQATRWDDLNRLLGLPITFPPSNIQGNATDKGAGSTQAKIEVVALSKIQDHWGSWLDADPEFSYDGKTRRSANEYFEYYNIMWVEWKDGVAYRKGMGRVDGEYWEHLQTESVNLVLG
ncbi:hypothetical protein BX600DRAFT_435541 [Xylariales sp. PMI_506]|nr:hypothetical protein BX600DRAFT_435541 [Xylariales sp. PMI_506]